MQGFGVKRMRVHAHGSPFAKFLAVIGHNHQKCAVQQLVFIEIINKRLNVGVGVSDARVVLGVDVVQVRGGSADPPVADPLGDVQGDGVGRVGERVPGGYVFVDGSGVGDIGPAVLRDREALASEGFVIVVLAVDRETGALLREPEIVSRGFVYVRESSELLNEAVRRATKALEGGGPRSTRAAEAIIKDVVSKYLYDETRRRPMVIPVVIAM